MGHFLPSPPCLVYSPLNLWISTRFNYYYFIIRDKVGNPGVAERENCGQSPPLRVVHLLAEVLITATAFKQRFAQPRFGSDGENGAGALGN